MTDLLFLALGIAFFVLASLYVSACDAIGRDREPQPLARSASASADADPARQTQ